MDRGNEIYSASRLDRRQAAGTNADELEKI
jgi:hypothetical protein